MTFEEDVKNYVAEYVEGHIPSQAESLSMFSYIQNQEVQARIAKEYYIARYIYKFFEGMKAENSLLDAQVRLQVILFANIYEAIIHEVLFAYYNESEYVHNLKFINSPIEISIPESKLRDIKDAISHDGKQIKTYFVGSKSRDINKLRFDSKADAAASLGLIDEAIKEDMVYCYNLRNGIHLHAELRKEIVWDLEMSKAAYWRVHNLNTQIKRQLLADSKIAC
jgi:hypothetical protein